MKVEWESQTRMTFKDLKVGDLFVFPTSPKKLNMKVQGISTLVFKEGEGAGEILEIETGIIYAGTQNSDVIRHEGKCVVE